MSADLRCFQSVVVVEEEEEDENKILLVEETSKVKGEFPSFLEEQFRLIGSSSPGNNNETITCLFLWRMCGVQI